MAVATAGRPAPTVQRRQQTPQQPSRTGPPTLDSISALFKGDAFIAALKKESDKKQMVTGLATFAENDRLVAMNMETAGEIYHHFLLQSLDVQRTFVEALCATTKVEVPKYPEGPAPRGRQETGRAQLIAALYGRWPEMLEVRAGSRDSKAGMRVTSYMRAYRIKAGLIQPRVRQIGGQEGIPKTGPRLFAALAAVAQEDELDILIDLAHRAGIGDDFVQRWLRGATPAPSQPEAEETNAMR